jgi:opacity protein-like surface antigen
MEWWNNGIMEKRDNRVLLLILLMGLFAFPLPGDTGEKAVIPGSVDQICLHTNFFYNYPSEDFFYFLNERLLFTEKPDGKIQDKGLRNKLLRIIRWHKVIKRSLQRIRESKSNLLVLHVADREGYRKAAVVLNLLGLHLQKTPEGEFRVTQKASAGLTNYYQFSQLDTDAITRQMNKTNYFYFKLQEGEVPVPWEYQFLREVTDLDIDARSFFEVLLKNEHFSLLLGVLYRLPDREIDHISNLVKMPRLGAWKQIYNDKKFLMGMFLLSQGLRLNADGQWALPGGAAAETSWCQLAEKHYKKNPLEFLYQLATKDQGKLNYFYLFSTFLPPETQEALFVGTNAQKMQEIYHLVSLSDKEKLTQSQIPRLEAANFYTLLYALRTGKQDNRLYFPPGVDRWLTVMPPSGTPAAPLEKEKIPEPIKKMEIESVVKSAEELKGPLARAKDSSNSRGLYLKINGGTSFLNGGDFNHLVRTHKSHNQDLAKTTVLPFFIGFAGELGYDFKKIAVGIEVGNISRHFSALLDDETFNGDWDLTFSAVPVLLNVYFTLSKSPSLNLYLNGGGGVYFGKYRETWDWRYQVQENRRQGGTEQSTGTCFGFHLGGGLEFNVSKRLLFFAQVRLRAARFDDMYGEGIYLVQAPGELETFAYEGDLYYLKSIQNGLTDLFIGTEYDKNLHSGEKAVLQMSGLTFTLGIKLRLF